jgi:predicted nucleic acid-binding protein
MKYLLDTNVLREIGKTTPHRNVITWLDTVDDTDLAISALTVREVVKGIAKLRKKKPDAAKALATRTKVIFDAFEGRVLPIDGTIAAAWGEALAVSERHVDDAGLAATAVIHGLVLVTRNTKDFAGRGIGLLNPFKLPPQRSG